MTARELAVLAGIAEGLALAQVARRQIWRGTVANYVTAALCKLGTPHRTAAVVLALPRRWLCLKSIDVTWHATSWHATSVANGRGLPGCLSHSKESNA